MSRPQEFGEEEWVRQLAADSPSSSSLLNGHHTAQSLEELPLGATARDELDALAMGGGKKSTTVLKVVKCGDFNFFLKR